jgi:hypothetical protein
MQSYTDHKWEPWRFDIVPKKFWSSVPNRRKFLQHIAQEHQAKQFEEWYSIFTLDVISKKGGRSLLELHNGSAASTVMENFPEHSWEPWRFSNVPKNIVAKLSSEQMVHFVKYLQQELKIRDPSDWYRISWSQIRAIPAAISITAAPGSQKFLEALDHIYPGHRWEPERLLNSAPSFSNSIQRKSIQRRLKAMLFDLLLDVRVSEDCLIVPAGITVDIFVPSLSLAIDCTSEADGKRNILTTSDHTALKAAALAKQGVALVQLPHSWDGNLEALETLIGPFKSGTALLRPPT